MVPSPGYCSHWWEVPLVPQFLLVETVLCSNLPQSRRVPWLSIGEWNLSQLTSSVFVEGIAHKKSLEGWAPSLRATFCCLPIRILHALVNKIVSTHIAVVHYRSNISTHVFIATYTLRYTAPYLEPDETFWSSYIMSNWKNPWRCADGAPAKSNLKEK